MTDLGCQIGDRGYITLDSWAGCHSYVVEIVGETPKKWKVRMLSTGTHMWPGRRQVSFLDEILVPKHRVRKDYPPNATFHEAESSYRPYPKK